MHRACGLLVYGKPFIERYTYIMQPLYHMLTKDFVWSKDNIDANRPAWEIVKQAFANMLTLAYPDYNLEWVLLPDWNPQGIGWLWVQLQVIEGNQVPEVIKVGWTKLTEAAARAWPAIKGELYAIYTGLKDFSTARGFKAIHVRTDHQNLAMIRNTVCSRLDKGTMYGQWLRSFFRLSSLR